jgi:hypothetical protein
MIMSLIPLNSRKSHTWQPPIPTFQSIEMNPAGIMVKGLSTRLPGGTNTAQLLQPPASLMVEPFSAAAVTRPLKYVGRYARRSSRLMEQSK